MTEEKEEKQNRTTQITIRLEPKIYDGLQDIANRVGIKPASIAGLAIGDYVTKAQASYGAANQAQMLMVKEMAHLMFEQIKPMLTEDHIKSVLEDEYLSNNLDQEIKAAHHD